MATVKNLRELVSKNGGEISLGRVSIRYSAGKDLDIYADGQIVSWLEQKHDENTALKDIQFSEITKEDIKEKISGIEQENAQLKTTNQRLHETLSSLESQGEKIATLDGMVKAYEKILIGRDISALK